MRPCLKLVLGGALASPVSGLLAAPDSPCAKDCGNVLSSTTSSDMVCKEGDYSIASAGIVYENCIECQLQSGYSDDGQSDMQWMLYNLRYNVAYCLFGDPDNQHVVDTPCITKFACGGLKDAIEWGNLTTQTSAYDYCHTWNDELAERCSQCLVPADMHYVNNYITLLSAACQQQPAPGSTLSIEGNPFSVNPVIITTPSPTFVSSFTDTGPISLGAKVGIAMGGIALILAIAGCGIVCNGRRRRRAFLRRLEAKHVAQGWLHLSGHAQGDTPMSQKPLRGWEDSPVSAHTEQGERAYPRYVSPYSSQFNSPVSAIEGPSMANAWPTGTQEKLAQLAHEHHQQTLISPISPYHSPQNLISPISPYGSPHTEIGIALGGNDPSIRSKPSNQSIASQQAQDWDSKGKDRDESYEMHEVDSSGGMRVPPPSQPPVLQHPGYGRNNSPPRSYYGGLTAEDARRGNAL